MPARAFAAPINREVNGVPQVLHFGASVRNSPSWRRSAVLSLRKYRKRRTRGRSPSYQCARPSRGRIGDEDTFWGLEAATLWGPFALQGEYAQLDVDLPGGASSAPIRHSRANPATATTPDFLTPQFIRRSDPTFTGWYVEGSWFFGGHKTYEEDGRWGRPKIYNPDVPRQWRLGRLAVRRQVSMSSTMSDNGSTST